MVKSKSRKLLKLFVFAFNLLWTALFLIASVWIIDADKREILKLAEREAYASYNKDLVYRRWAAEHGGVYVPVTEDTQPNPLLQDIPERDITTPSGKKLTLVNPAFMTRQVVELGEKQYGLKGHITSLKPILELNKPDEWEREALLEIEQGKQQVSSVEMIDGQPYLRFMGMIVTEQRCLKCHAFQGYRPGDVRGGISVSVPLAPYQRISTGHIQIDGLVLFLIWLMGLLFFNAGTIALRRQIKNQEDTEAALQESEQRWRTIVNSEPECVKLLDAEGRLLEMNPAGLAMIDATMAQVRGAKMRDLVSPEDRADFDAMIASAFNGESVRLVFGVTSLSGKKLILETTSVPIWDDPDKKNKVKALLGVTRDITKQKKAEEKLEIQTRILKKSQEISHIGSWHLDLVDNVLTWSDEQYRIFGRSPREFGGTYEFFLETVHPEDREMVDRTFSDAVANNLPYECIHRIVRSDGEERVVLEKSEQVADANGNIIHSFGYTQDITELHRAEKEKQQLESQLLQAYKMEAIGTMAGGIAHDFNNILGIILGNAEIARIQIPSGQAARENIDGILNAANRAKDLVRQILTFSRREKSKKKPFYLCRLVDESMKAIRPTIPASVDIQLNIPPKCRENVTDCQLVLIDPTQLHQILLNLCINAVQAMDEKGLLEVGVREVVFERNIPAEWVGLEPGTYEYLTVKDTGPGMSPEIVSQIFDPFFTTKDVGKGTGMGLAVVHGIVEEHGGKIYVESEPGKGTTFHLFFPATLEQPENQEQKDEQLPVGNERILLVDDEKLLAGVEKELIECQGYSVTVLTDSVEALKVFKADPAQFDLVITDQTMPKMTGLELAEKLLRLKPGLPIILCTGHSSLVDKVKAAQTGICEFTTKPLDRYQIARLIRRVLDDINAQSSTLR